MKVPSQFIAVPRRRHLLQNCLVIVSAVILAGSVSGCAGTLGRVTGEGWVADYDKAERRARDLNKDLLIFYKDTRFGVDDKMADALEEESVRGRINDFVKCTLVKPYEADRRYVAQFGVDRAPALILVHADGTYHARGALMSPDDVMTFLVESSAPGKRLVYDPYIPREPCYRWTTSLEAGRIEAMRNRSDLLVVYHRSFTRDWSKINDLLERDEVFRRFAGAAHCKVSTWNPWVDAYITPFGAVKLPSLVLVSPDGSYSVLELPDSVESVVRFADGSRRGTKTAVGLTSGKSKGSNDPASP